MVPSWALSPFPLSLSSLFSLYLSLFASARAFYAALLSSPSSLNYSSVTAYSYLVSAFVGVYGIVLLVFTYCLSSFALLRQWSTIMAVVVAGWFPAKTSRAPWFVSVSVLLSVSLFSTSIFSPLLFLALFLDYTHQLRFSGILGRRSSLVDRSVIQEDDTWRRGGLLWMPFKPLLDHFCSYRP